MYAVLQMDTAAGRVRQKMCDTKVLQGALADHCELLGKRCVSCSPMTTSSVSIIVHCLHCSLCACNHVFNLEGTEERRSALGKKQKKPVHLPKNSKSVSQSTGQRR